MLTTSILRDNLEIGHYCYEMIFESFAVLLSNNNILTNNEKKAHSSYSQ